MKKIIITFILFLVSFGVIVFYIIPKELIVLINDREFIVEVPKTDFTKQRGLMYRKTLKKNHGMLFVFKQEEIQSFWMKNVNFPLLAIFIDSNKKIIDIQKMDMCREKKCTPYISKKPAKYVLEVGVENTDIKLGDIVKFK